MFIVLDKIHINKSIYLFLSLSLCLSLHLLSLPSFLVPLRGSRQEAPLPPGGSNFTRAPLFFPFLSLSNCFASSFPLRLCVGFSLEVARTAAREIPKNWNYSSRGRVRVHTHSHTHIPSPCGLNPFSSPRLFNLFGKAKREEGGGERCIMYTRPQTLLSRAARGLARL